MILFEIDLEETCYGAKVKLECKMRDSSSLSLCKRRFVPGAGWLYMESCAIDLFGEDRLKFLDQIEKVRGKLILK